MSQLEPILAEMRALEADLTRGRALLLRAWREAEGPVQVLRFTARRRQRLAECLKELVRAAEANPPARWPLGACR